MRRIVALMGDAAAPARSDRAGHRQALQRRVPGPVRRVVTTASGSLEQLAREQAALRRVATLVAREPPPDEVFTAVTREAGTLLGAQRGTLLRVASPQWAEVVASWSDGTAPPVPVGHRGAIDEGRGSESRTAARLQAQPRFVSRRRAGR